MKLEHVIARAMAELRLERDWTQADLAWRMTAMGVQWQPNRVSQLESLRRPISLFEVAALSWVFEVPITRLLPGDQTIEAPDGKTIVSLQQIRAALTGDTSVQKAARDTGERHRTYLEELRSVAKAIDVEPTVIELISKKLYGHPFIDERDKRVGSVSHLSKQSARTKRGHATRAIIAEIRDYVEREGRDAVLKGFADRRIEQNREFLSRIPPESDAGE